MNHTEPKLERTERVGRKFILSAATGMALAIIVGHPIAGWLNDYQEPKSLAAFHLAKAGVDRAVWEIEQHRVPTETLYKGDEVPGLSHDKVYRDVPGGTYKVYARFDPDTREFKVVGTGTDASGRSRSLEVLLRKQPNNDRLRQVEWKEVTPQI